MISITERLEGGCGPSGGSGDRPCERQTGLAGPLWPAPNVQPGPSKPPFILHPRPKELIPCLEGPRQTRTPTARPPGPGAGSIRPQAVNKEKAGAASESRAGLTQHPKVPAALRGLRPRPGVYGCSSTRASLCPGPDAEKCTASPNPLAHCRLSSTPRDKGDGGDRKVPGAATRRSSRHPHRLLPARHSAPRADTARGVAEPSRRAASAPDSPWPHCPGREETDRCASLPRRVRDWSRPNAGHKPPRS